MSTATFDGKAPKILLSSSKWISCRCCWSQSNLLLVTKKAGFFCLALLFFIIFCEVGRVKRAKQIKGRKRSGATGRTEMQRKKGKEKREATTKKLSSPISSKTPESIFQECQCPEPLAWGSESAPGRCPYLVKIEADALVEGWLAIALQSRRVESHAWARQQLRRQAQGSCTLKGKHLSWLNDRGGMEERNF